MMKVKLEKQIIKIGQEIELPDFSFNHAYIPNGDDVFLYYLVPQDDESTIKAQTSELVAHLLREYR